jgi:hypothetical protein
VFYLEILISCLFLPPPPPPPPPNFHDIIPNIPTTVPLIPYTTLEPSVSLLYSMYVAVCQWIGRQETHNEAISLA